jgi:DNA-binding CsgD family transcriptional regulator
LISLPPKSNPQLTWREDAVFRLTALHHSANDIAQALRITRKTVYDHRWSAYRKLGGKEAANHYMRGGVDLALSPDVNELSPRRKLTEQDVAYIRVSKETAAALSKQFSVSHSFVCRIRRAKAWRNLA